MTESDDAEQDPALDALTALSKAAESGADDLNLVKDRLAVMSRHRRRGWSWRRIATSADAVTPLSIAARVLADFGRAVGGYRRALATALRDEGVKVTEIADLLDVSRQRISALVRPRRSY